jgi:hypothetical protein
MRGRHEGRCSVMLREHLATLEAHAAQLAAANHLVQLAAITVALDHVGEAPPWAREHRGRVLQEEHGPQRVQFYEEHPSRAGAAGPSVGPA